MQAVLDQLAALSAKPVETLSVAQARSQSGPANAVKALLVKEGKSTAPEAVGSVVDTSFAGPAGQVAVTIYTPAGTGPFPVALFIHGGGWVIGSRQGYDSSALALTMQHVPSLCQPTTALRLKTGLLQRMMTRLQSINEFVPMPSSSMVTQLG